MRGVFEKYPGSGVWSIRYTDANGKYRRELAGTKSRAIRLYQLRKGERLEGKLPELRKRTVPFAELVDAAAGYVEREYARPADDLARLKVIKGWFPGSATRITPGQIRLALEKAAEEKNWSESTTNHHHNLICLAYRLAIENEKLKESPIHGKVRKRREDNSRVKFLTPDQEKKLREVLESKPEWREHEPELTLALHTGLRRRNMYRDLVWENVDLQGRVAKIPRTNNRKRLSKNGDPIDVPLNDTALGALRIFRSRGDGTGRVVRNLAGETLNVNAHWFPSAVRAAGIKDFRWHDLRHTFASRLRQKGVPLGNIAELLGHKGLAMTRRYAHLAISNLHEAVSRINSTTVAPEPISTPSELRYVN